MPPWSPELLPVESAPDIIKSGKVLMNSTRRFFSDTYFLAPEIAFIPLRSIKNLKTNSLSRCLRQLSSCVFLMSSLNGSWTLRFFREITEVTGALGAGKRTRELEKPLGDFSGQAQRYPYLSIYNR